MKTTLKLLFILVLFLPSLALASGVSYPPAFPGGTTGQIQYNNNGVFGGWSAAQAYTFLGVNNLTGPAAITSFAGTVAGSGTTITFSQAADAILAGYNATSPVLGAILVVSANTMHITAWLSSLTATVDVSGTIAAATPTSVQLPIATFVNSSGVITGWVDAAGASYFSGNVGIGTTGPSFGLLSVLKSSTSGDENSGGVTIWGGANGGSKLILGAVASTYSYIQSMSKGIDWVSRPLVLQPNVGGKVGIGETSPGSLLSVKGGISVGETTDYSQAAAPTGGMIIKGNVGIGTTTPQTNIDVVGASVLGSESLANNGDFSRVAWTLAGDFAVNGTSATFTKSTGAGTITQAAANQAQVSGGNRHYQLQYTIASAPTIAGATMTLTSAFASTAVTLPITAGTNTVLFESAASPGSFVISVSGATSGAFTITSASLKEIQGGSVSVGADIKLGPTIIPFTTTGNVTINKSSGRVNIAGSGSSVTVTDNLVTAYSTVMAVAATNDSTCSVKNVVLTTGSFTINTTAPCTGTTGFSWVVFN
jgi:hypothetical protein